MWLDLYVSFCHLFFYLPNVSLFLFYSLSNVKQIILYNILIPSLIFKLYFLVTCSRNHSMHFNIPQPTWVNTNLIQ